MTRLYAYDQMKLRYPLVYLLNKKYFYIGWDCFRECSKDEVVEYNKFIDLWKYRLVNKNPYKEINKHDVIVTEDMVIQFNKVKNKFFENMKHREFEIMYEEFLEKLTDAEKESFEKQIEMYIKIYDCIDLYKVRIMNNK